MARNTAGNSGLIMSEELTKIDTQGMSGPSLSPEEAAKAPKQEYKPMMVKPHRLHTDMMVKELKILINEVLDEREGKSGISYFDTEHFIHYVGENEPPYEAWK